MGAVVHEPEQRRLVAREEGHTGVLEYRRDGDRMELAHTLVPPAIGGRGVGGRLVQAAVEVAAGEGLTVVPSCSFAAHWLRIHPEEAQSVAVDWD